MNTPTERLTIRILRPEEVSLFAVLIRVFTAEFGHDAPLPSEAHLRRLLDKPTFLAMQCL